MSTDTARAERARFLATFTRANAHPVDLLAAGEQDEAVLDALALASRVIAFCDQVERENATERTLMPLSYAEAVVIEGSQGVVVVHRDVYVADRVAVEARAGEVTAVTRGTEFLEVHAA